MTSTKDAERLADLLRRRADVYHPARRAPSYYGDDDIDLLRSIIDRLTQERDEARRSAGTDDFRHGIETAAHDYK